MRMCVLVVSLLLVMAGLAYGADVDGKWSGTVSTPGGDFPVNFTFKADGAKLTGSMLGQDNADIPIKDGKIDGSNISFSVTIDMGGEKMELSYKGVVSPEEIKLSGEAMGTPFEFVVKKAK